MFFGYFLHFFIVRVSPPVDLTCSSVSAEEEAVRVAASVDGTSETDVSREAATGDSDVLGEHELRHRRLSRFDSSPAAVERQTSSIPDELREEDDSG